MSSATLCLTFDDFAEASRRANMARARSVDMVDDCPPALRIALLHGEQLHIPKTAKLIHVLSGRAWISAGGKDFIVGEDESLRPLETRYDAVISAVGCEALFFELT